MAGRFYTAKGYANEIDIENFLLLDIDDSFAPQVEDWIAAAENQVDKYLGYTTASGIFREQISNELTKGIVSSNLDLKVFPRKSPVSSLISLDIVNGSTALSLSLEDGSGNPRYNMPVPYNYIVFPQDEMIITGNLLIQSFSSLRGTDFFVRLSYIAGYSEVPADIRLATVNLVSDTIMRHSNKDGLSMITQGRVTKKWKDRDNGQSDFVKDAYELLKPYRLVSQYL